MYFQVPSFMSIFSNVSTTQCNNVLHVYVIHGKIIKFVNNLTTHLLLPFVHDFGKMKGIQIITYCL